MKIGIITFKEQKIMGLLYKAKRFIHILPKMVMMLKLKKLKALNIMIARYQKKRFQNGKSIAEKRQELFMDWNKENGITLYFYLSK